MSTVQNIQVAVRCRSMNEREMKLHSQSLVECSEKLKEIIVSDRNNLNTKKYSFDKTFGPSSKQVDVYNQLVRPVVNEVLEGYNCTIFAYGQTGTGKTYTMEGYRSKSNDDDTVACEDDPHIGIIPRAVSQLFSSLNSLNNCEFSVKVSYMELYNEELSDLLNDESNIEAGKLRIFDDPARKGSVIIPTLTELIVPNKGEVFRILQQGAKRRQKAATLMNASSSRSHSIFTTTVFIKEKSLEGEETIKVGKLNLVDLAGSENIERSGATGQRATEAGKINKSLTTLGRVITALVEFRDHIPYRESNLTRLLQDSLGGKTKTTIIATISPAACNIEETMSTLDYAHKAKSIKNKPEINQKLVKKALIKEYTEEIDKLKRELQASRDKIGVYLPQDMYDAQEALRESQREEIRVQCARIGSLTDELVELTENYRANQDELHLTRSNLRSTETALSQTKRDLLEAEKRLNETKYLVNERTIVEAKLYKQAECLNSEKIATQDDCLSLHDKIDRLAVTLNLNRQTTNNFSSLLVSCFRETREHGARVSNETCQQLDRFVKTLDEVCHKLQVSRNTALNSLIHFGQKQSDQTNSAVNFIRDEILGGQAQANQAMQAALGLNHQSMQESCAEWLKNANEAFETFNEMCGKQIRAIDATSKAISQFEVYLGEKLELMLSKFVSRLNANASYAEAELSSIKESISASNSEVMQTQSANVLLKNQLNELNTVVNMLVSIKKNADTSIDTVSRKLEAIRGANERTVEKLSELDNQVETDVREYIHEMNSQIEINISEPIKAMNQESNSKLKQASALVKTLSENNETANNEFLRSMELFKTTHEKNFSVHNHLSNAQSEHLSKACNTLEENLLASKDENELYFDHFVKDTIVPESSQVGDLTEQAKSSAKLVKAESQELGQKMGEFFTDSIRKIERFSQYDIVESNPTGKTPMKRVYNNRIELAKTRPNEILIEEFYNKQEQTAQADGQLLWSSPLPLQSIEPNLLTGTSNVSNKLSHSVSLKSDVGTFQVKRVRVDTNWVEAGEKVAKLPKSCSTSQITNNTKIRK